MRPVRFSYVDFEASLVVQTSCLWMSALGLVDGHRHGEQTYCPSRHDSTNQYHSKILCRTLEDCAYEIDSGGDHDGLSPTKAVHGEPTPSLVSTSCVSPRRRGPYINEPKKAPPEKVALTAPIIGDDFFVLKKSRKFWDWMTIVITPESYPKRKLPVPAKMARAKLKKSPMVADAAGISWRK